MAIAKLLNLAGDSPWAMIEQKCHIKNNYVSFSGTRKLPSAIRNMQRIQTFGQKENSDRANGSEPIQRMDR